jgi:hypothetical protein
MPNLSLPSFSNIANRVALMSTKTTTFWFTSAAVFLSALVVCYKTDMIPMPQVAAKVFAAGSVSTINTQLIEEDVKPIAAGEPALPTQRHEASTVKPPLFELHGDQLSVHATQVSLESLLHAIATKSGITLVMKVPSGDSITMDFNNMPLLNGLRQLTTGYDCIFYFDDNKARFFGLSTVEIVLKGQGHKQISEQLHQRADERQLSKNSHDPDANKRAYALEQLIKQKSPDVLDIVSRALTDADAQVRFRALNMAITQGVALSADFLQDIFQTDSSSDVRAFALSTLATAPDMNELQVEAIADSASNDADPLVATIALEILDQFDYKRRIESLEDTSTPQ